MSGAVQSCLESDGMLRHPGSPMPLPDVDRSSIVPIYRQIYEELRDAILAGSLPELSRLPPERSLAERLGVNRSTVVHAYRELAADGLIEQRVGSGSRVAPSGVTTATRDASVPWWIALPPWRVGSFPTVLGELAARPHRERIAFVQGIPPESPSPIAALNASFATVGGVHENMLSYGDSEGHAPLREAIAERMQRRGCTVDARDVLVITGSTQGISLVAHSLAEPGDEIVVEQPTYPGALQIFQIAGLRAIPVAVDDEGMRVDQVEAILRTRKPRFIYTMPSLQNPTGAIMSADRRQRLVKLAKRARVPIVEDDPYGELVVGAPPPLVAASRDDVVYVSTFSKTIAPSLRLGWLTAPRAIAERLLLRKQSYDMATSLYVQAGVGDYLARAYDAHVVDLRAELVLRRELAERAVAEFWPAGVRVAPSAGGYYLWATLPREYRARALLDAAERRGASFLFGEAFYPAAGGDHALRLALTPVPRDAVRRGIERIGAAFKE